MTRRSLRLLATLLTPLPAPNGSLAEQLEPLQPVEAQIAGKVVFVRGKINDKGPFTFIVDTGATETIVTPSAAERAGLGSAGSTAPRRARVRSITVGNQMVRNLEVVVFDPPQALSLRLDKAVDYHAILGYTFLSQFIATIDYKNSRVLLQPSAPAPSADTAGEAGRRPESCRIPFELRDRLIHAQGTVNGKHAMTFLVDTGSAEVLLTPESAKKYKIQGSPLEGYEKTVLGRLDSMALGQAVVSNVPVIIRPFPPGRYGPRTYDGIIGYPFLSNFSVAINYRSRVLELSTVR